jgi:hypothetical protein
MKRRLPNTRHGGSVLVMTSLPPHTTDTNNHNDPVLISWRAVAAACAQPIAAIAAAGTADGQAVGIDPPNSTVNDANPDHHTGAVAVNRRTHARTVVNGTSNTRDAWPIDIIFDATSARARPTVSTTSKRPTSRKFGSNACDTEQAEQRARAIHNRRHKPSARTDRS